MPAELDAIDMKILELMQRDASLSTAELAERVGLSQSPCWRRIQRLREEGYIKAHGGDRRPREARLQDADLRPGEDDHLCPRRTAPSSTRPSTTSPKSSNAIRFSAKWTPC